MPQHTHTLPVRLLVAQRKSSNKLSPQIWTTHFFSFDLVKIKTKWQVVVFSLNVYKNFAINLPIRYHHLAIFSFKSTSEKIFTNKSLNRETPWSFSFSLSLSFASTALMSDNCVKTHICLLVYLFIYFLAVLDVF